MEQLNIKKAIRLSAFPILGVGLLRFLLALAVVFTHTNQISSQISNQILFFNFIDGGLAVQSFFIISGFYMALILTEKYKKYSDFIINRFLRIFPFYFTVFVATILISFLFAILYQNNFALVFYSQNFKKLNWISSLILAFSNLFIVGQDITFSIGIRDTGALFIAKNFHEIPLSLAGGLIVPQSWTLSLEILFYVTAPFFVKQKNNNLICFIGLSCLINVLFYSLGLGDPWTYRFFPTQLMFFLTGILCYRIYAKIKQKEIPAAVKIFPIALILLMVFYYSIPVTPFFKKPLYFLLFIASLPILFIISKNNKTDRYIGELSYPIYLVHVLIIELLGFIPISQNLVVAAAMSVFVSIFAYKLLIKPIDTLRHKVHITNN